MYESVCSYRGAVRRVVSDSQADSVCSAVVLSPFCHPYLLSMVSKVEKYRNKFVQGGPHATSETGQAGQVLTRVHNNYNEFPLIQYKDFDELLLLLQLVLVQKKRKIKRN